MNNVLCNIIALYDCLSVSLINSSSVVILANYQTKSHSTIMIGGSAVGWELLVGGSNLSTVVLLFCCYFIILFFCKSPGHDP